MTRSGYVSVVYVGPAMVFIVYTLIHRNIACPFAAVRSTYAKVKVYL